MTRRRWLLAALAAGALWTTGGCATSDDAEREPELIPGPGVGGAGYEPPADQGETVTPDEPEPEPAPPEEEREPREGTGGSGPTDPPPPLPPDPPPPPPPTP